MQPQPLADSHLQPVTPLEVTGIRSFWYPGNFLSNIIGSLVIWVIGVVLATSAAALIFQGELAPYYGTGIGMVLVSAIIISGVMSIFGADRTIISYTQSTAAVVMAAVASSIVQRASPALSADALFYQVVITIILAGLLTGIVFLVIGLLRIGNIIRYIPYPVIGGFLAGSGWLLVIGAIEMMVDVQVSASAMLDLFAPDVLSHWLPGLVLAVVLIVVLRWTDNVLLLPVILIGAMALFYAWVLNAQLGVADLVNDGWLLGSANYDVQWQLPPVEFIGQINVDLLIVHAGGIMALIVLSSLHMLLNAGGLELVVNRDLDFNRLLTVTGFANVLGAILGGGIVGFPSVSITTVVHRMRANGRFVGLMVAILLALTMVRGTDVITLFPRILLGGLLMYLGFNFLTEWLIDGWFKLPKIDYVVVVLILLTIAVFGILEGVIAGFLVTTLIFVIEYSRISIVKQELSGDVFRSNMDRSYEENMLLQTLGQHIWIIRLQGFIFFGTSHQFLQRIRQRLMDPEQEAYLYIILDFTLVRGIDTSAAVDLIKLKRMAETHGFRLIFTGMSPALLTTLRLQGFDPESSGTIGQFETLDYAMEWCENDLLRSAELDNTQLAFVDQFTKRTTVSLPVIVTLMDYLEPMKLDAGTYLAHQDDEPDVMYFIESGRVDIRFEIENGRDIRIRSMSAGTIIGEIGFYLGRPRSASMIVTEAGTFHRLTRDALYRMEKEDPEAAAAFHVFVVCILGERLTLNNEMVRAFMA